MGFAAIGLFFLLLVLGVPIAVSVGLASAIVFAKMGITLTIIPQKMWEALDSFPLVAVPFFILTGDLLAKGLRLRRPRRLRR